MLAKSAVTTAANFAPSDVSWFVCRTRLPNKPKSSLTCREILPTMGIVLAHRLGYVVSAFRPNGSKSTFAAAEFDWRFRRCDDETVLEKLWTEAFEAALTRCSHLLTRAKTQAFRGTSHHHA